MSDDPTTAAVAGIWDRYEADPAAWEADGALYGWRMPLLSRWQRLPLVRYWLAARITVALAWRSAVVWDGMPPGLERDAWVIYGLRYGLWR